MVSLASANILWKCSQQHKKNLNPDNYMLREFVFKLITSQAIHFQTNWPSNKKEWQRKGNEQGRGEMYSVPECFYFTTIIGTNKYKYHIVCDWKSILLLNIYKWWRKRKYRREKKSGIREIRDNEKRA